MGYQSDATTIRGVAWKARVANNVPECGHIREATRATCHQCSLYIAFRPPIKGPTVWLNWPRIWDNFRDGNKTLCSLLYEIFETGRKVCHKIRIGNCFQKTCQIVLFCCLTGETRSSQQGVFFVKSESEEKKETFV